MSEKSHLIELIELFFLIYNDLHPKVELSTLHPPKPYIARRKVDPYRDMNVVISELKGVLLKRGKII